MDIYSQLVQNIIKEQEAIIGPVALEQAQKVSGLTVDWNDHKVIFAGDKKEIIGNLVKQYEELFGRTSVEVCKEAVKGIILQAPRSEVPQMLL